MSDHRSLLEREMQRVELRPFTLDRFHHHRRRKERGRRMASAVLALVLSAAAIAGLVRAFGPSPSPVPAGDAVEDVFFPTLKGVGDGAPGSLATGTLIERNGCLFLETAWYGGYSVLVLWPEGWSLERAADGSLRILDESGVLMAKVGDKLDVGGGHVGEARNQTDFPEELIAKPIPNRCKADGYWYTGGVERAE